jgi:hypothetical protein
MSAGVELARRLHEVHNAAPAEFPDLLHRSLHEDAVLVELPVVPGARTHHGRDAIVALFRERFETGRMLLDEFEVEALDDRRVMVSFKANFRGAGSGAEASMPIWNLMTLDGDRIVMFEEFADEQSALAAARGER